MVNILRHLELLADSVPESDVDRRGVEEWLSIRKPGKGKAKEDTDQLEEDLGHEESWNSIVDASKAGPTNGHATTPLPSELAQSLVSRLISKPNAEPLLNTLHATLSSSRPNDAISEELVEIIGFDDLDLATEILSHRAEVTAVLGAWTGNAEHPVEPIEPTSNKSKGKARRDGVPDSADLSPEAVRKRMQQQLRDNAARPLFTGVAHDAPEVLPHVYSSSSIVQNNILSQMGSKYLLPMGTTRHDHEEYEEVVVPPAKPVPPRESERLISVAELDDLAAGSFPGYKSLNRVQSIVYPTAYGSNENLLICAPTGAGKTDVAMLTVLRVLDQHRSKDPNAKSLASTIDVKSFKIIYVAPMKALAAEIVRKLGSRLKWLAIRVRELTGDMQLTKAEIEETQIIVTTPEKWDVVTRKPTGEGELVTRVKLLIIDEVHLLNEDRGAVIETIVARTLRQVESSQSVIRIVGLSATLPNYIDVADFLSVSRYTGLFYFDSSFRPVPLEQHFIGVKGKPNSPTSKKNLDRVSYEKVAELVNQGHQVMVFVHARKETVKTAQALREAALAAGALDEFSCQDHPQWSFFRRDIGTSRNKEMKQLFDDGFGIHHAGMLRSDRNMMERMFGDRAIKVLCCTATLAWGVNLPAHAVIIKGTQVYDSSKGSFVDLSVLDVLQVFGRAGRPGLESSGEGYICTTEDKLTHYLDAVTSQNPIESKFVGGMVDALNAEIALGTVATVPDGVQWLGYTYLFVRMRKNPFQYGLSRDELGDDPQLGSKRAQLIAFAAQQLAEARMIIFDRQREALHITDIGRIAAKYYIRHSSILIFNKEFRPKMTEADILAMLSLSTEFDQVQTRESEQKELEELMNQAPCAVKGGTENSHGKVNILLQGYISGARVEDFALVSDTAYVAQNAGRIIRALLEIAISRKWANASSALMGMSKAIEKRMWPYDHPLKQFTLKYDVLYNLERWADNYTVPELAAMSAADLGKLIHLNEHHGAALLDAAKQFPTVEISYELRPLGSNILKIAVHLGRVFNWSSKIHGSVEPFWVWIEDHEGLNILQMAHLVFRQSTKSLDADFVISIPNGDLPPSMTIRFVSDRWIGAEEEVSVSFDGLVMPKPPQSHTPRLDLPFLSSSVLQHSALEDLLSSKVRNFNALQTQVFWSVIRTRSTCLVCGPPACGKSTMLQILSWSTLTNSEDCSWVLVVTPRRSFASELISEMRPISRVLGISVELATEQTVFRTVKEKTIKFVAATQLLPALAAARNHRALSSLKLVACDSLEQLDPAYEAAVSLLRQASQHHPIRFVGFASSLNDPTDLAAWLDVDPLDLYDFKPVDSDQSLTVSTQTFTIPHSAALLKTMAKPAYSAIRAGSSDGPAIVFVPSRGQCRPVALDLITQCALGTGSISGYLPPGFPSIHLEDICSRLQDFSLADVIRSGVGIFHDGVVRSDRALMLDLYADGIINVLIVPREACWTLPVRAAVVVVMGTQYFSVQTDSDERQLREYGLDELVRMQGRAVRHGGSGHFHLFCQAESKDTYVRLLEDGLPLESKLLDTSTFSDWYKDRRKDGSISSKQDAMDILSWTYLARRIDSNPAYYDVGSDSTQKALSRIVDVLDQRCE
ncbi:Sec63-domain-containing protein [Heliocybe sulcata]|uniref:Sec63-domain-containing protein n=1 Tax=Heliocybe sulcata TaxID=5364 RepID=A0A5C3NEN5_9AGAM|nr:Sec63-domain-containing protein [Heliocybe sulcata]